MNLLFIYKFSFGKKIRRSVSNIFLVYNSLNGNYCDSKLKNDLVLPY